MSHLGRNNILSDSQHGFRRGHSCETQLVSIIEHVTGNLDLGHQIDMILLDFSKAFHTVPHQRLLAKIENYGIQGKVRNWIEAWLCHRYQTLVVEGERSNPGFMSSREYRRAQYLDP